MKFPNLFQVYSNISSRELEIADNVDNFADICGETPIDTATGLATKIMGVDFTQPLEETPDGAPIKANSDANKFGLFLWKMLDASESGSIGGDACRFFNALDAAYADITALGSTSEQFQHLLGWNIAVASQGIGALLERGDPDRNRWLFKKVAEHWKKIFKQDTAALGINDELRKFAIEWCGHVQKMLKSVKKNYGEYSENYSFNFIYTPRPKKAAAPVPTVASHLASLQDRDKFMVDVAVAAAVAADPKDPSPKSVADLVTNAIAAAAAGKPKVAEDEDDDDETKPWEEEGWVPRTKNGKQKTPNVIRGELQRYIDKCKQDGTMTQTKIIEKMGVNNNTFRRYMNPKTYKDQWSATQNGTYWAAARLLEEVKHKEAKAKKAGGAGTKRKAATGAGGDAVAATSSKKNKKEQATDLINRINAVQGVTENDRIYDSCPMLVTKIKEFLNRDGVTKAALLKAMGDLNSNSLNRFLAGKNQDQCGNVTYKRAYVFFEKLRILEGKPKSSKRLSNEANQPQGFSTESTLGRKCFVYVGRW